MCNLSNLTAVPCDNNTPGLKGLGYAIPCEEVTADPTYVVTTAEGDYVIADDDFTLTTTVGKGYFRSFPMLMNRNSYAFEAVGAIGSKSIKETFTFVVAGVNAEQVELFTRLRNIPSVFLCTDKEGNVRVIGRKDDPAYVETAVGTTGAGPEEERIITFTVTGYTSRPMIYTGAINTTPAD